MSVKTRGLGLSSVLVSEEEIDDIRKDYKNLKKMIKMLAEENSRLKKRVLSVERQASSAEEMATKLLIDFETKNMIT